MRIISKPLFRDFYDGVQGFGQDDSLIFKRSTELFKETHTEKIPEKLTFFQSYLKGKVPHGVTNSLHAGRKITTSYGMVLFAGNLFPFVQVRLTHVGIVAPDVVEHYHCDTALNLFYQTHGCDPKANMHALNRYRSPSNQGKNNENFWGLNGLGVLAAQALEQRLPIVVFRRENTEGFLNRGSKSFEINGKLSSIDFARRMDAWQAYQELSMFLGNIAAPEPITLPITDKDRHQQHGFDEYSFRKLPSPSKKDRV